MTKIETIQKLNDESLLDLLKILLKSLGLENLRTSNGIIRAEESTSLRKISQVFICVGEHLNANADIEAIIQRIHDIQKEEAVHVITIVSNNNITLGFQKTIQNRLSDIPIEFIGRDELITHIDAKFPDYWRHDDVALVEYEHQYEAVMESETQLKLLHLPSDKMKKLMNVFIQPSLVEETEDNSTHMLVRKRIEMSDLVTNKKSVIISGIAGSGKSTLLYNIGLSISRLNNTIDNDSKKQLPVFITAMDLITYQRDVKEIVLAKTANLCSSIDELVEKYDVTLLVDSIDEFEQDRQKLVIRRLVNLYKNRQVRFILATRSDGMFQEYVSKKDVRFCSISRFNTEQIRRFVNALLPDDQKANDLLDALRENKIIERLPITPLTLSLISILFDETDYEIPATITDIYAKFNDLVVGRAIVSSKIEYIDVNFRERILSMYGYQLMISENHQPMTYDDFIRFFANIYSDKSKQIKGGTLEEGLEYIVKNTGILYIKDGKYICFAHDTYMEYYAAVEFFNFHRREEEMLVDNFFDLMWQNVAVFYAGITKDMDDFAKKINNKLKEAARVMEYISGVQGAGYLLQAIYFSNDLIRRDVISTALDLSLETNEAFKKMTTMPDTLFKNYRIPIVQLLSLLHFYEMFNSVTLKVPLELCFDSIKNQYEDSIIKGNKFDLSSLPAIGYKLVCLAFTLDSKRLENDEPLSYLLDQKPLLSDISVNSLINISMEVIGKTKYKELREHIRKEYYNLDEMHQRLLIDSSMKTRFSAIDTIHPLRKVKLFVEGKTDAIILEHAFMTLTHGRFPYWNVEMATQNGQTGSTHAVTKAIDAGVNYAETYDYIIGIYDHDKAGLGAYRKLDKQYDEIEKDSIKRSKIAANVYLLCIPIPGEMSQYLQEKQDFNFFEIEHYLGHDYLREKGLIKEESLRDVYEIKDAKKTEFASVITKENNSSVFKYFVDLFLKIDKITGVTIDYDDSEVSYNADLSSQAFIEKE